MDMFTLFYIPQNFNLLSILGNSHRILCSGLAPDALFVKLEKETARASAAPESQMCAFYTRLETPY